MNNLHYISDVTFYSNNMKEAIVKHHTLPLWTPYYYSGRPLFAQPEYYFIDFNLLLILLTGNVNIGMNFSVIIHLFLAGLGMYYLVLMLSSSRKAAFISALLYMFNGFVHTFVVPGNIMIMEGYSLIPFIFLFTVRALKNKEFIFNSIMAGLFAAFLIFVGGVIYIPYIFLLIMVYSVIYVIDKNILNRFLKLLIVGVLIFAVGFGISAVKLLPGLEFIELSNRGIGLPYQEYLGEPIKINNFGFAFITNVFLSGDHISAAIGIAGIILLIFSLSRIKNKLILFSAITIILSLLISTDSFLTKILFNVPIFNQVRHVERSIFMFAFASSILAGFGFVYLESFLDKYKRVNKNIIFSIIILLILSELFLLQMGPESTKVLKPDDIPILDYMSKDKSQFRIINQALTNLIGATGYNYYSQFGISELKGGSGIWFNDYIEYLTIAQYKPAKFWGVLNVKYVIKDANSSEEGLSYVGKFKECSDNCEIREAWGPYLYKNEMFLPRYYVVPNSILIAGDNTQVRQLVYNLMLKNLNPKSTVLIEGAKINDYDINLLTKFNSMILVQGSIDQDSISKLREYKGRGGVIMPDILNNKNTISNEEISSLFNSTKGAFNEIKVSEYSNNKVVIDLNGEEGWLVASERLAYFPGWTSSINGNKKNIFEANNAISAIHLNGEKGKLIFEYSPDSFTKGKIISFITLIILFAYSGYLIYIKKFKSGDKNKA